VKIFDGNIKAPIIIGVFLVVILLLLPAGSCKFRTIERIEETRELMGTYVSMTVFSDEQTGTEAIDAAFDRMEKIVDIASIYDEDSEASMLNKKGYLDNPSPEFLELINASVYYYNISGGCFDITVQPLLDLWSGGLWQESEEVQAEKISEVLDLVGSDMIEVAGGRIEFMTEGMSITLNAIAKGYAVDKAIKVLEDHGISQALVNAGGDLYAMGTKTGGEQWVVQLEDPDDTENIITTFTVEDKAVTTSGGYHRYYDLEKEVHHITDPRTGYSASSCKSVTIIADSCIEADALATSVYVMGPDDGMELVESLENVEALIIDADRKISKSSGLLEYID
jgi:thiamine biosynthesis lipoprotein